MHFAITDSIEEVTDLNCGNEGFVGPSRKEDISNGLVIEVLLVLQGYSI